MDFKVRQLDDKVKELNDARAKDKKITVELEKKKK